jgi:hypothetical protein
MAIFVFTQGMALVNSVDLSDHCSKITTKDDRAQVDVTPMGSSFFQFTKGLGTGEIDLDFFNDFAAAKVHATLQPLISSTTGVPVEVRPVNTSRSATNPAVLLASALMFSYPALDGSVGQVANGTYTFMNAPGGTGVTYPTS